MTRAKYRGRCSCGATFAAGDIVGFEKQTAPCPGCGRRDVPTDWSIIPEHRDNDEGYICGASCTTGRIPPKWVVTSCPACSVECRRVVDSGEGMKQPGSNLAARLRRKAEKERKRRAKE